jgi:hypothetical protein
LIERMSPLRIIWFFCPCFAIFVGGHFNLSCSTAAQNFAPFEFVSWFAVLLTERDDLMIVN